MTARNVAYDILLEFAGTLSRLDSLIHTHLTQKKLKPRETKNLYNLVFGVVRHLNTLDWKIKKFYAGNYNKALNKLKTILRLAFFEIDYQQFIPPHATVNEYVTIAQKVIDKRSSGIVNGVLRSYLREQNRYNPAKSFKYAVSRMSVQYSFPEWMIQTWIKEWGDSETEDLCRAFNERPGFNIRIHPHRMDAGSFRSSLADHKIDFKPSKYFSDAVKISDIQALQKLNYFRDGVCAVQDESAMFAVELLDPGPQDRILDACAAPGGKYTAILLKTGAKNKLTGLEPFRDRLQVVRENCETQRLGLCLLVQGRAEYTPFKAVFDKIMVDVPCSGTGTIRKNPDIKWRRTEEEIENFHGLQLHILRGVADLIKPGGIILYSTCSIQRRENEDVVFSFLETNRPNFNLVRPPARFSDFVYDGYFFRTFPHRHDMDGSFAALLQRTSV